MAKVTIREYDSSEPSVLTGAYDLPIYIPGYANFGPENEPTLIAGGDNALATFKSIFGDTPYVFKADQVINGETVRYKGDYEQSYIEAYEYASVTNGDNVARVLVGGDMLQMDVHGEWNHSGVLKLHLYVDVYYNDDDEAVTYWMSDYVDEMIAFAKAMSAAMQMALGGAKCISLGA